MTSQERLHKNYSFLIDVNLPQKFNFFNYDNFFHVAEINPKMKDADIWNYAIKNNLVIVTKDADFYDKFMSSDQSPKIIYFQLGNMKIDELYKFFELNWRKIVNCLDNADMIIATRDELKALT